MNRVSNFTEGKIFSPLLKFAIPILMAMFLQTMYGAVDLLIVGQFGNAADVSAVSTGSQVMFAITSMITGLTMGITILIGQKLGEGKRKEAGNVVGSGISIFAVVAVIITVVVVTFSSSIATLMHAPSESFDSTVSYLRICAMGAVFVISYNVIGGVFRGLGDSKTPLITVGIACTVNIIGDLIFVAGFKMAATGAACATVLAQSTSVILSLILIKRRGLPFEFSRKSIKFHKHLTSNIIKYGSIIYSELFSKMMNKMFTLSINPAKNDIIIFLSSLFFIQNMLGRDSESLEEMNIKYAADNCKGNTRRVLDDYIDKFDFKKDLADFDTFINAMAKNIPGCEDLTTKSFTEQFMLSYGANMLMSLEYLPTFIHNLACVEVGSFLNNQNYIENQTGKFIESFLAELSNL